MVLKRAHTSRNANKPQLSSRIGMVTIHTFFERRRVIGVCRKTRTSILIIIEYQGRNESEIFFLSTVHSLSNPYLPSQKCMRTAGQSLILGITMIS